MSVRFVGTTHLQCFHIIIIYRVHNMYCNNPPDTMIVIGSSLQVSSDNIYKINVLQFVGLEFSVSSVESLIFRRVNTAMR